MAAVQGVPKKWPNGIEISRNIRIFGLLFLKCQSRYFCLLFDSFPIEILMLQEVESIYRKYRDQHLVNFAVLRFNKTEKSIDAIENVIKC